MTRLRTELENATQKEMEARKQIRLWENKRVRAFREKDWADEKKSQEIVRLWKKEHNNVLFLVRLKKKEYDKVMTKTRQQMPKNLPHRSPQLQPQYQPKLQPQPQFQFVQPNSVKDMDKMMQKTLQKINLPETLANSNIMKTGYVQSRSRYAMYLYFNIKFAGKACSAIHPDRKISDLVRQAVPDYEVSIHDIRGLRIPNVIVRNIKRCLDSGVRLIAIPLHITSMKHKPPYKHIGLLLYDVTKKELEQFERTADDEKHAWTIVVNRVASHLNKVFGKNFVVKTFEPNAFCPRMHRIQAIQQQEDNWKKRKNKSIGGYCPYFATLYAYTRFAHPEIPRDKVLGLLIDEIHKFGDITHFIDRYAKFATALFMSLKNYPPNKHYEIIKKYM